MVNFETSSELSTIQDSRDKDIQISLTIIKLAHYIGAIYSVIST